MRWEVVSLSVMSRVVEDSLEFVMVLQEEDEGKGEKGRRWKGRVLGEEGMVEMERVNVLAREKAATPVERREVGLIRRMLRLR